MTTELGVHRAELAAHHDRNAQAGGQLLPSATDCFRVGSPRSNYVQLCLVVRRRLGTGQPPALHRTLRV
jgi:hypothetical protein